MNEQRGEAEIRYNRGLRDKLLDKILDDVIDLRQIPRQKGGITLDLDHYTLSIVELVTGLRRIIAKIEGIQHDKDGVEHKGRRAIQKLHIELEGEASGI